MSSFCLCLSRFFGCDQGVAGLFPVTIVLVYQGHQLIVVEVSRDQEYGVVRSVKTVLVQLAVGKLVRHVQDVFQIPERGVFVGVCFEGCIPEKLE